MYMNGYSSSLSDTLDDDDEVLWALAEQLGDNDFVVFVGGADHAHTLLVSTFHTHTYLQKSVSPHDSLCCCL